MSGDEAEARDKGGNSVVVTGGFGFRGYADSGPGGGPEGGGGRYERYRDCYRRLVKRGG